MINTPSKKPTLPLIRLQLVAPIIQELERRHIDISAILSKQALRREDFSKHDMFVPAPKMYALVEQFSAVSGDPHFGFHVGEQLNPFDWSPIAVASQDSGTVGEFLLRFMQDAGRDENSVTFILKTIGSRSTFHERRFTNGGIVPRHNDGFTVAYLLTTIRRAVGKAWNGSKVLARVCDPAAVPAGHRGIRVAGTDTLGASISFPATWLIIPLNSEANAMTERIEVLESIPPATIVNAFRQALLPHIHEFDLNAKRVAEICGLSKRTLARKLQNRNTCARDEIVAMRRKRAEMELQNTESSIASIAAMVGYPDPAVFSRAFKRWTGKSPRQYRKEAESPKL